MSGANGRARRIALGHEDATAVFFVDTNLLVYALDSVNSAKQHHARAWLDYLWSKGNGRVSWQVLHEFYWNATRKIGAPVEIAQDFVRELSHWAPVDSSLGLITEAWGWCQQAQLAYWDGLIVAAAERCAAGYLLSEDLQAGRRFDQCTVLNPFRTPPPASGLSGTSP